MRSWLVVAMCGACGGGNAQPDAAIDTNGAADGLPDAHAPTCAGVAFTTSDPVGIINTAADETFLRLSPDELTAYFVRAETVATAYVTTRASTSSPFSTATALTITGNAGADVSSPSVTADGLTLYFVSSRTDTLGAGDLWRATRSSIIGDFGTITQLTSVSSTADELDVFAVPDGSAIYFSSSRTAGVYSIWRAQKNGAGFDAPVEVLSQSPSFVNRVVIAPNELTMLYQIGNDLRLSTRASTATAWQPGAALTVLNSANADNPTWISPDLCRLYFQTNRPPSMGLDFHIAVRAPE